MRIAALLLLAGSAHFSSHAQAQQACVPYAPTKAGETIESFWKAQFERHNYNFTVPNDPGGGYVVARIETKAPSRPQMRIIPPSGMGTVTQVAPTFPNGPSPQVLEVAFEVDAGSAFNLEIFEDAVSQPDDFPVPYKWGWTFYSRVDCFEPNDGRPRDWPGPVANSKTVPLDQAQEAYSLAGHLNYAIGAFDDHNFDWYNFKLEDPVEVWLATLAVPEDQSIRLRLFNARGDILLDKVPEAGQTGVLGPARLQPGVYYLDLHPEVRGEGQVTLSEGESLPPHFEQRYQFIVSTRDPGAL